MAAEEPREHTFGKEATAGHSFDQLARELADGTLSRRRALRMMGAALVGGVLASVPGVAWAAKPAPCPPGVQKCGKACCPDATFICAQGKCACPTGTTRIGNTCCQNAQVCGSNCGCQTGEGCCNGVCTDLSTTINCGACGNACTTGQSCENQTCVTNCPPGQEVCNGACVPTCDPGLVRDQLCDCVCSDPQNQVRHCFVEDPSHPEQQTCVCCSISAGDNFCCSPNVFGGNSCRCCPSPTFCCPGGSCCPEVSPGVIDCFSDLCV